MVSTEPDPEPHPFHDEWSFQRRMSAGNPVAGKPIAPDQPCFDCGVPFAEHNRVLPGYLSFGPDSARLATPSSVTPDLRAADVWHAALNADPLLPDCSGTHMLGYGYCQRLAALASVTPSEPTLDAAWKEVEAMSGGGRMSLARFDDDSYEATCWPFDRADTLAATGKTAVIAVANLAASLRGRPA